MHNINLFKDYENANLLTVEDYREEHPGTTYCFDQLGEQDVEGIPVCLTRDTEGRLQCTFIPDGHVLGIGATRSGKTTGFVLPTVHTMLNKKNKPSMVISDPKQELYCATAEEFRKNGYRVLLLDFTDYTHSDCWNPLVKCYRAYRLYSKVEDEVGLTATPNGMRNTFRGKVYEDQGELERDIREVKEIYYNVAEKEIEFLRQTVFSAQNEKDPFWVDSARDLFAAILYGMLEDSELGFITEKTFSFDTVLRIFDAFTDSAKDYDGGYFVNRDHKTSKAYQIAHKCVIEQADTTRRCISSEFATKINKFRDTAVRRITCTNSFELSELDDGAPTVIFVSYKDEESLHYDVISMFLTDLYSELIEVARKKGGMLSRPFYFMLDEFGNLPKFADFEKVISACGGRNIWFLLILQSYAQLNNVYGKETAEIIKDNLNTHIFFGTNNPQTKREFSEECGKKTVIAPTSALNGEGESVVRYDKDTVALVPVSALARLKPGECVVTQMREDVLWSWLERSYLCEEFRVECASPKEHKAPVMFMSEEYRYNPSKHRKVPTDVEMLFIY